MEMTKKSIFKVIITMLVVLSLSMNGYLFHLVSNMDTTSNSSNNNQNASVETVNDDVKSDLTEVIKNVSDSVVGVAIYEQDQLAGSGSGVIYEVDGDTAYIITNNHVIDGANQIQVVFANQESVEAELIGGDQYSDIAVLKVKVDFDVSPIKIGDSDLLDTGESVLAIGSPLGIEYAGTVTQGIVSATDRTISVDLNSDGQEDWDMNVIQTDAAINPGNSGGAFVNAAGELVGITSMKFSDTSVEGMGFAIPINTVMKDVAEIRETGKVSRPVVGIQGMSISGLSKYELRHYNIDTDVDDGIYVATVQKDSAADKAGIEKGDVIVKFGDVDITTYKSFLTELYSKKPGETVKVVVNRDGTEQTIDVTLGE
ncbi:MAG: S1C family serine protease [Coprobacillaceae bacterium]